MHNFGEGYRELLEQQRVEWEAAHPDATLPPLQLPVVPEGEAIGTNPITVLQRRRWKGSCYPLGWKARTTWSYWKMTAT